MTTTDVEPRRIVPSEYHSLGDRDLHALAIATRARIDQALNDAFAEEGSFASIDFIPASNEKGRILTLGDLRRKVLALTFPNGSLHLASTETSQHRRHRWIFSLSGFAFRSWDEFWTERATARRLDDDAAPQQDGLAARQTAGMILAAEQHDRPPAQSVRQISTLVAAPGAPQFAALAAVTH